MSFYGAKVKEDEGDDNYKICSLANESGTGEFAIYKVLPGIRVVYNDMHMKYCGGENEPSPNVIEINHCKEGRFECNFGHQTSIYLSPGGAQSARLIWMRPRGFSRQTTTMA